MHLQPLCDGKGLGGTGAECLGTIEEEYNAWNEFCEQLSASMIDEENISLRPSTSFFDQSRDLRPEGTLKSRLILSRWYRSLSLLAFSTLFLFSRFFASFASFASCSDPSPVFSSCVPSGFQPVIFSALGAFGRRSDGRWFTTASFPSSSSATARFDQDRFAEPDWGEEALTP